MKARLIGTTWWLVSFGLLGAAIAFPYNEAINSLAMANVWILIALGIAGTFLLIVVYACQFASDDDLRDKSVKAINKMADNQPKSKWFRWVRLIAFTVAIALAAMPVTAVAYVLFALLVRIVFAALIPSDESE